MNYIFATNQKTMRLIALIFTLTAFSIQSYAQDILAQAKSGDNWGYINAKGEFVIKPQFTNCHGFSEGLAPIYDKKAKTFYFIKPDGSKFETEVEKFKLKNILGFGTIGLSEGMVPVQVGKKWGYMNASGKMVAEAKFDKATKFNDGKGVAKLGEVFFLIDSKGTETKVDIPGIEDVKQFSGGVAPFKAKGLMGFIDQNGAVTCEAQFKGLGYMSEDGLAWAKNEAGLVGFVSKSGDTKIEFAYKSAKNFTDGVSKSKKGESTVYVSSNGKEIVPESADSSGKFSDGLAYAKSNGKVGFIGKDGKWVVDPQFDKVRGFKNGLCAARQGDMWGFIDTSGKWVIKPQYDAVKDFEKVSK